MYDDFDLDYTYDYSSSLDEDYADRYLLDENEEHARESTDFQQLAYMHYAVSYTHLTLPTIYSV